MGKTVLLVSLLALSAVAQAADRLLTGAEIAERLSGHTYRHADVTKKVEQIFHVSGDTYYIEDSAQSQGRWEVRGDQYCSQWPPGESWSCYTVAIDGEVLTFISKNGARYPVVKIN